MKKIIDLTLDEQLKNDEFGTVDRLRSVIKGIIHEYGDITNATVKLYNSNPDADYEIKISISTIRNYLKQYHYVVKKDLQECIVREMGFPEYVDIRQMLDKNDVNEVDTSIETTKSVPEMLAVTYVNKSEQLKEQKLMSIRCASSVQNRLNNLADKYPMFTKQYLLSLLLDMALTELGE